MQHEQVVSEPAVAKAFSLVEFVPLIQRFIDEAAHSRVVLERAGKLLTICPTEARWSIVGAGEAIGGQPYSRARMSGVRRVAAKHPNTRAKL